ncbi:acetylglutamate kinase [Paludifilum halophilum]|uniref:Acetylglutamate kinase n=1 Tax=Paludifilum halophilum TaxID=1642702 RepID=A0A235B6Z7_9BACL|nr:acetylglutamate kinase [Paludifilum halophilum]OYD08074.1 acetylglutamate kinase [Paludifilum halophilum]
MKRRPVVIKVGGNVWDQLHPDFFAECTRLWRQGFQPVIVHGGGPEINRLERRLGIQTTFKNGLRVTDDQGLQLVEMVLAGRMNKAIVSRLERSGAEAVGVSGVDRSLIRVRRKAPELGWVGEVEQVRIELLTVLMEHGWIPVVASIGVDQKGRHYNVNADTAAGAVARALRAEKLILVTNVPGICAKGEVLAKASSRQVEQMVANGQIRDGMVPKVTAALNGLKGSVAEAAIVDGRVPGSLAFGSDQPLSGTRIRLKEVETCDVVSDLFT